MTYLRTAASGALLALFLVSVDTTGAQAEDVVLIGYQPLSQLDPKNYRDPTLMQAQDTLSGGGGSTAVANLTCAATVYTMIERAHDNTTAVIDDFYVDPRPLGGDGPGARRPKYVGDDALIDLGVVEAELRAGHPVILHGQGGPLREHFVLATGAVDNQEGGRELLVLDPWPAQGDATLGREVRLAIDNGPIRHPLLSDVTFKWMRRVGGPPSPIAATSTAPHSIESASLTAEAYIVATRGGDRLVGKVESMILPFKTNFGMAEIQADNVVHYRDGTLDLTDGTTLKGTLVSGIAPLQIVTSTGRLAIALDEIVSIQRQDAAWRDGEAAPTLVPGDGQGTLTGRLFDNFGKPLAGVEISVENTQFSAITDYDGNYAVPYVPGHLVVKFTAEQHYPLSLSFDIAQAAEYPVDEMRLVRHAPAGWLYLPRDDSYEPMNACYVERVDATSPQQNNSTATDYRSYWQQYWNQTEGADFSLFARGEPARLPADRNGYVLNTMKDELKLYRVMPDGSYFTGHAGMLGLDSTGTSAISNISRTLSPDVVAYGLPSIPGQYVFVGKGEKSCLTFEVVDKHDADSLGGKQLACEAAPSTACLLDLALSAGDVSGEIPLARVRLALAEFHLNQNDRAAAVPLIDQARHMIDTTPPADRAAWLNEIARLYYRASAGEATREALAASLDIMENLIIQSPDIAVQLIIALEDAARLLAELGENQLAKARLARAIELIQQQDMTNRAGLLVGAAAASADMGEADGAELLLHEGMALAKSTGQSYDKLFRFRYTISALAAARLAEDDVDAALSMLDLASDPDMKANALLDAVVRLDQPERRVAVDQVLADAAEIAADISSPDHRLRTLLRLADLERLNGRTKVAQETLAAAANLAANVGITEIRFAQLMEIARAQARLQNTPGVRKAFDLMLGMSTERGFSRPVAAMADAAADSGLTDVATQLVTEEIQLSLEISDPTERLYDMLDIVAIAANIAMPDESRFSMNQAVGAAQEAGGHAIYERSASLAQAAFALSRAGHPSDAIRAVTEINAAIVDLADVSAMGLAAIAVDRFRYGDVDVAHSAIDAAVAIASTITPWQQANPRPWLEIAFAQSVAGDGEAAMASLRRGIRLAVANGDHSRIDAILSVLPYLSALQADEHDPAKVALFAWHD